MKKRGFTLIELIVVLAIMSIVLGIGLFRFNTIDKIKTEIEIQNLINDLQYAKAKAHTTGNTSIIVLNRNNYRIVSGDNYRKTQNLRYIELQRHYTSEVRFYSTGSVGGSDYFYIKYKFDPSDKNIYKLIIAPVGGRSRIEKL